MEHRLIIDWEKIHLYNSLMALIAGAAFLSIWSLMKKLNEKKDINPIGTSLNFAVVGIILFITGVHTTLTWPLSPTYPFDNSIFGEPCFVFGSLLLALSYYFWKGRDQINALSIENRDLLVPSILKDIYNFRFVIMGIGFSVIAMGLAGIKYRIFIAPPEEPLMGPMLEVIPNFSTYVVGLTWIAVGVAALMLVYNMRNSVAGKKVNFKFLINFMLFLGINFMFLGVSTHYTHVGMEINTMDPSTIKPNVVNNPDTTYHKSPYR